MEATIQQHNKVIFTVIAILVVAFLMLCAVMAWHDAGYRTTVTESATTQWSSDTSWTGGW